MVGTVLKSTFLPVSQMPCKQAFLRRGSLRRAVLTLVAQVVLLYCKGTSGNIFVLCAVPLWLAHDNPGSVLQQTDWDIWREMQREWLWLGCGISEKEVWCHKLQSHICVVVRRHVA